MLNNLYFENVVSAFSEIKFHYPTYVVGGWVRDRLLNRPCKDIDLCMIANYNDMVAEIKRIGGVIFLETPEFLTIRCKIPVIGVVDVACARKDSLTSDGRRPDSVILASNIEEDLRRRDCTINAMALDLDSGKIVDPFNGLDYLRGGVISPVGVAFDRIREDYLRILRYFRFHVVLDFYLATDLQEALKNPKLIGGLSKVSKERIREEMIKCFRADTVGTIKSLGEYRLINEFVFGGDLWLIPTFEARK